MRRISTRARALALLTVGCLTLSGCYITVDRQTGAPADRIVILGDSLAFGLMEDIAARFSLTSTEVHYRGSPGTGLLTGQGRFGPGTMWENELQTALDELSPQIVVIESLGVYPDVIWGDGYYLEDGTPVYPDTPLFWQEWEAAARRLMAMAENAGATVWWVQAPTNDVEWQWRDRINGTNALYGTLGRPVIDLQTTIAGADDPLSIFGGLHFTDAGEPIAANAIVDTIVEFQPING